MGKTLDELRNRDARVNQCMIGLNDLVAATADRAGLKYLVADGVLAGGLQVQCYIDLFKRGDVRIEKHHLTPVTTSHIVCQSWGNFGGVERTAMTGAV